MCTFHITSYITGVLITRNLAAIQQGSACITLFKARCQVETGSHAAEPCNLTTAAQPWEKNKTTPSFTTKPARHNLPLCTWISIHPSISSSTLSKHKLACSAAKDRLRSCGLQTTLDWFRMIRNFKQGNLRLRCSDYRQSWCFIQGGFKLFNANSPPTFWSYIYSIWYKWKKVNDCMTVV